MVSAIYDSSTSPLSLPIPLDIFLTSLFLKHFYYPSFGLLFQVLPLCSPTIYAELKEAQLSCLLVTAVPSAAPSTAEAAPWMSWQDPHTSLIDSSCIANELLHKGGDLLAVLHIPCYQVDITHLPCVLLLLSLTLNTHTRRLHHKPWPVSFSELGTAPGDGDSLQP